jgi:hypothetical protein
MREKEILFKIKEKIIIQMPKSEMNIKVDLQSLINTLKQS